MNVTSNKITRRPNIQTGLEAHCEGQKMPESTLPLSSESARVDEAAIPQASSGLPAHGHSLHPLLCHCGLGSPERVLTLPLQKEDTQSLELSSLKLSKPQFAHWPCEDSPCPRSLREYPAHSTRHTAMPDKRSPRCDRYRPHYKMDFTVFR